MAVNGSTSPELKEAIGRIRKECQIRSDITDEEFLRTCIEETRRHGELRFRKLNGPERLLFESARTSISSGAIWALEIEKADPNSRFNGHTALDVALENRVNRDVIKILRDHGVAEGPEY